MESSQQTGAILILCLLGLIFVGCGRAESYVKGQITFNGKGLSDATVTFHPVAGGGSAYGTTDDQGNYQLKTGSRAGLAAGEYRVTVVGLEPPPPDWPPGKIIPSSKRITPDRYARPETTDLVVNITPGGNIIDLPLTSEPKS